MGKGLPCDYDNDATTTTILLYLTYTVTTINYDNDGPWTRPLSHADRSADFRRWSFISLIFVVVRWKKWSKWGQRGIKTGFRRRMAGEMRTVADMVVPKGGHVEKRFSFT